MSRRAENKKIGRLCLSAEQMMEVLRKDGQVESNSGKNRSKLYDLLTIAGLTWSEEIIGYTEGKIDLDEWTAKARKRRVHYYGHGVGDYASWIRSGRIRAEDVRAKCDSRFSFEAIEEAWDKGLSHREVCWILWTGWRQVFENRDVYKHFPLNAVSLRKPIKRIVLTSER